MNVDFFFSSVNLRSMNVDFKIPQGWTGEKGRKKGKKRKEMK